MFFGAIWSCGTSKKKTIILSGGPLGVGTYVPMSLWPYMSLCTYVPSLDFKTCHFVNNWWWGDHAPVGILLLYLGLPSSPSCLHFNTIFMSFVANSSISSGWDETEKNQLALWESCYFCLLARSSEELSPKVNWSLKIIKFNYYAK